MRFFHFNLQKTDEICGTVAANTRLLNFADRGTRLLLGLCNVCAEEIHKDRRTSAPRPTGRSLSSARSLPDLGNGCQPLYFQEVIKPSLNLANFLALIPNLPSGLVQKDQ
jgi:hypothetical protein